MQRYNIFRYVLQYFEYFCIKTQKKLHFLYLFVLSLFYYSNNILNYNMIWKRHHFQFLEEITEIGQHLP